ncbi:MAG: AmmeMemoRadiSam system protein A [Thermodesulfobacteriota bacterium]
MALSETDKSTLLRIARSAIESRVRGDSVAAFEAASKSLHEKRGAFVSIHKRGGLRGCIGVFTSDGPLYAAVAQMAVEAATSDHRFPPVTEDELPEIELEISVLTPLKKTADVNEIEVGRHGIYIMQGGLRGVLLPQVATDHGFDREEFLEQTCMKAGLPEGAWKEEGKEAEKEDAPEIYTFEAEVFKEQVSGKKG